MGQQSLFSLGGIIRDQILAGLTCLQNLMSFKIKKRGQNEVQICVLKVSLTLKSHLKKNENDRY